VAPAAAGERGDAADGTLQEPDEDRPSARPVRQGAREGI
jgi:hypothetical protein